MNKYNLPHPARKKNKKSEFQSTTFHKKIKQKDLLTLERDYVYRETLFSLLNLYLYNVFYENPPVFSLGFFFFVILKKRGRN